MMPFVFHSRIRAEKPRRGKDEYTNYYYFCQLQVVQYEAPPCRVRLEQRLVWSVFGVFIGLCEDNRSKYVYGN